MNVVPGASYEAVIETGETGQVGDLGLLVVDNIGGTTVAFSTATIIETPAGSGVYAAVRTAPSGSGRYTIVWKLLSTGETFGIDDLWVTSTVTPESPTGDFYVTVDELARVLKIRVPTADQEAAMERALSAAAGEINAEIDFSDGNDLAGWQLALVAEVNLERAVEHWQQSESPFGIIGIGDGPAVYTARDSWDRHAHKLAPLKEQWGLA